MKKKRIQKKLVLSKETLRNLSERDLQGVVGARGSFNQFDCLESGVASLNELECLGV